MTGFSRKEVPVPKRRLAIDFDRAVLVIRVGIPPGIYGGGIRGEEPAVEEDEWISRPRPVATQRVVPKNGVGGSQHKDTRCFIVRDIVADKMHIGSIDNAYTISATGNRQVLDPCPNAVDRNRTVNSPRTTRIRFVTWVSGLVTT